MCALPAERISDLLQLLSLGISQSCRWEEGDILGMTEVKLKVEIYPLKITVEFTSVWSVWWELKKAVGFLSEKKMLEVVQIIIFSEKAKK